MYSISRILTIGALAIVVGWADCVFGGESSSQDVGLNGFTEEFKRHVEADSLAWELAVHMERIVIRIDGYDNKLPDQVAPLAKMDCEELRNKMGALREILQNDLGENPVYAGMKEVLEAAIEADDAFAASHGGDNSTKDVGYWEERIAAARTVLLRCQKFDKSYYDSMVPPEEFRKKLEEHRRQMLNPESEEAQNTIPTNTQSFSESNAAVPSVSQTNANPVLEETMNSTHSVPSTVPEADQPPKTNASFPKSLLALLGIGVLAGLGFAIARMKR